MTAERNPPEAGSSDDFDPAAVIAVAVERAAFGAPGPDGKPSEATMADVEAILGLLAPGGEAPAPGGTARPFGSGPLRYAAGWDEEAHPRDAGGQFTSGPATDATPEEVKEAQGRLLTRAQDLARGENVDLKRRQYLGQVKDFFTGHGRLDERVASTHVFFDPEADEDESGAASVNWKRHADGRAASAPTVRIGPRGLRGEGSSGSLGDSFVHEVEHLVDHHAGKQRTEFTPRFRQMMRELAGEEDLAQFLNRHGRDNAGYYVDGFFGRHPGHDLTDGEKAEAVEALVRKARALYEARHRGGPGSVPGRVY